MSESPYTPEQSNCPVDFTETANAFSEMHLTDSPRTTYSARSGCTQSRLREGAIGRALFPVEVDKTKWVDKEVYALILFLMLYTDGKCWVAHKDMKFWNDAGIFVQKYSGTLHCRTGKISRFVLKNLSNCFTGTSCRSRATKVLAKQFRSPKSTTLLCL